MPENLGGAPQAELELRVLLLLIPASFTALGQLPGMGGKLGRGLGQAEDAQGAGRGRTGRASLTAMTSSRCR